MSLDSLEQAWEFFETAQREMKRHGIPPTPENFQVWYTYASGRDPELVRAIDILIDNRRPFSYERNAEIVEQFFGAEASRALTARASRRIEELTQTLLAHIGAARQDAGAFGSRVRDISSNAGEVRTADDIEALAEALVNEVRDVVARTARIERDLDTVSSEASELRESLVEMRREATTDPLTGLANRREFSRRLTEAAASAAETGEPLSIILLDVDRFKDFNDRYGHRIGDEVLKLVAGHLRDNLKGRDLVARYGGEEFVALLSNTDTGDATRLAEQIRRTLATRTVRHRTSGETYGTVSATFGIATYCPGESLEQFINRADAALYRGKRDGRNRVEVITEDSAITL